MNIFQRLESLKNWYDQNNSYFKSNLSLAKKEFDQLYKSELTRFSQRSKQLHKKKANTIKELQTISYDDWVEQQFQKMLKEISRTLLESVRDTLIQRFKNWIDSTSRIDYAFRILSFEKEIADKIIENMNLHDNRIKILKELYQNWKTTEEEKFDHWLKSHPYYLEMNELEYRYDAIADDDAITHSNLHYSYDQKVKFPKKKTIPDNWHRLHKIFDVKI
ncbi:MAG: hypothetical protein DWP97_10220 [Calditrichaeota bacterium]|nr:MAG: hypothetical protein DWP97_10220 [Calditrichota bacterium]